MYLPRDCVYVILGSVLFFGEGSKGHSSMGRRGRGSGLGRISSLIATSLV